MRLASILLVLCLAMAACTNWDRLEPDRPGDEGDATASSFTRLDGADPAVPRSGRLTGQIAAQRIERIQAVGGAERLELIESFLADYPEARMIAEVHRLRGEAQLTEDRPQEAITALRRSLSLVRRDVLDLPLDPLITYQLGMAEFLAGDRETGVDRLLRTSIVDRSQRVMDALRWAYAELGQPGGEFDDWYDEEISTRLVQGPEFELPGLRQESISLAEMRGTATLINFWSPT